MATSRAWLVALLGTLALIGQIPSGSARLLMFENDEPGFLEEETGSRYADARQLPADEPSEEPSVPSYGFDSRDEMSSLEELLKNRDIKEEPMEKMMHDLQALRGLPSDVTIDDSSSSGDETDSEQDKEFKAALEKFGHNTLLGLSNLDRGMPSLMTGPVMISSIDRLGAQQQQPADQVEQTQEVDDDDDDADILSDIAKELLERSMIRQAFMEQPQQQQDAVPDFMSMGSLADDEKPSNGIGGIVVISGPNRDAASPFDMGGMGPLSRFFQALGGGMRPAPYSQMGQQAPDQPMYAISNQGAPLMEVNPALNSGFQAMGDELQQPVAEEEQEGAGSLAIVTVPAWRIIERTVYIVAGRGAEYNTTAAEATSPAAIILSLFLCVMFIMVMIWAVMRLGRLIQGRRKGDSVTTSLFGGAKGGPYSPPAYVHTTLPSPATRIDTVAIASGADEKKLNLEKPSLGHSNV